MAENSFASASVAIVISLIIAVVSAAGALLLQVGSNVLSDVIQIRFGVSLRRRRKTKRLAMRIHRISVRRRHIRRLRGPEPSASLAPPPAFRPKEADIADAEDAGPETELAQAQALAERELRRLIALCAPELDPRLVPLAFTDGQTDVTFRREKVVATLERRAEALMRRGKRA
jgi:hypothetical protein